MTEGRRRHPNVINLDEVPGHSLAAGGVEGNMRMLGLPTGGRTLGCTHYEAAPGAAVFPHHFHCVMEEAIFILDGTATLRIGDQQLAVKRGDYITFPPGPGGAHQLRNTGTETLRYLCVSTLPTAEITGYPDSGEYAVMAVPSMEAAMRGETWVNVGGIKR